MAGQDSLLSMMKILYAYNSRSTGQLLKALDQLSEEQLTVPGCSGHGSIRQTLAHLIGTQWGWFSWFNQFLSAQQSMTLRISEDEINTREKLFKRWEEIDRETVACLEKLSEAGLTENWSATTPGGFTMTLPLWQLLLHVANHGTHTRAQIVAAIRRFGYEPGVYEFFRFALERKG